MTLSASRLPIAGHDFRKPAGEFGFAGARVPADPASARGAPALSPRGPLKAKAR